MKVYDMKFCSKCKVQLYTTHFHKQSSNKDGLRNVCKDCERQRIRADRERKRSELPTAPNGPAITTPVMPSPPLPIVEDESFMSEEAKEPLVDVFAKHARFTGMPVKKSTHVKKILFVPDTHVPYHDERAWRVMLACAKHFQPDHGVILGDFMDFYSVSSHAKDPQRVNQLEDELAIGREKLKELNAVIDSWQYVMGNHEDRLDRYLMDKAPALYRSMSTEQLLGLDEMGIRSTPYREHYKLGKLHITHDAGSASINAHRQAMDVFQGSILMGHTHRMEYSVKGNADGPPQVGAMFGWLGDFNFIDYMHKAKAKRDWVHGFGIGYLEPSGVVHLRPIPIINYSACIEGAVFSL